MLQSAKMEALQ